MDYFEYSIINSDGKSEKGVILGNSEVSVGVSLESKGHQVLNISPMRDFMGIRRFYVRNVANRIKPRDRKDFCEQLAFMLETDIPLNQALTILRDKSESKSMQTIAEPLCEYIQNGDILHNAMDQSGYFNKMIVYQIRAGEKSGDVVTSLKNIAQQMENDIEFKSKIKGAVAYPIMILAMMVVMVIFMLSFVVPKITSTIIEMGGELPFMTKCVIALSNTISWGLPLIVLVVGMGIFIYKHERLRNFEFCVKVDKLKLKIPLIGKMIKKMYFRDFSQRLSVMQSSGMTLAEGLEMTGATIGNAYIRQCVNEVKVLVEEQGISLSAAMSKYLVFDAIMIQMIEIGSKSGQIIEVLDSLAVRYKKEVENYLKIMVSLMEPIMIVVITIIVGMLMVAMYLPMMSMVDALQMQ